MIVLSALITGVLLLAGCAHVNTDVTKLPRVELGEPGFYPTLQAYAGTPIVAGNDVQVLLNGEQIFPALIAAIRAARTSITYAQYFFEEGPVAEDVIGALELNVIIYDRAVARRLEDVFKADVAHATPVDYERWRQRGVQARLFEILMLPLRDML